MHSARPSCMPFALQQCTAWWYISSGMNVAKPKVLITQQSRSHLPQNCPSLNVSPPSSPDESAAIPMPELLGIHCPAPAASAETAGDSTHSIKSCCTQPLANWNLACGAIGIFVSLVTFGTLIISKSKASTYADDLPAVADRGPDGRELTEAQKAAVHKAMKDHQLQQARMSAMYHGPVGKMYGFVQSTQSCYIMIMVIIGATFVWSTYPSSSCDLTAPTGCEPFLWTWTQGWVIVHFVFAGVSCLLMCCGVCAIAALRGKSGMEQDGIPSPGGHV